MADEQWKGLDSGFFNSDEGTNDRVYDAEDISSIFDGIINDGVYSTVGDAFAVSEFGGMNVKVGTGRAWFNHTWTMSNSSEILPLIEAPINDMSRIDAIVLEINHSSSVRQNGLRVVTGDASDNPEKPTLIDEGDIHQYPLAYVTIASGQTEVTQADIENAVGTDACPFVTGILRTISIEDLYAQWQAEFEEYEASSKQQFEEWFANLQYVLDGDVAGHLQHEIDEINAYLASIGRAEDEEY